MTGQIVLVRHGRTALNARGHLQGRIDEPLDDTGRRQARALGEHLGAHLRAGDLVIASPLVRARDTAAAIAEVSGVEVVVDERWIEVSYGVFEGRPQTSVSADTWRTWRADPHFAPPDGESLAAVAERVVAACEELRGRAAERTIVVVSHVSPIKAAVAWALGTDAASSWRMHLDTATVSRIGVTSTGVSLRSFNESHHLTTLS